MLALKENRELKGTLLILLCGILWGIIGPFIQAMTMLGANALLISFLRMFFSFVILVIYVIKVYGLKAMKMGKRQLLASALLGIICHGIYNIFYSMAVNEIGVTIGAVLLNVAPFFTAFMSMLLFHESMTRTKVIALVVNVLGCTLAATGGEVDLKKISLIGILFGVAAGFCYSMTAILSKIAGNSGNVFIISTYSYFFAALFLAIYGQPWKERLITGPKVLVVGFLYALIPTVIAYLLYYRGVQLIRESSKVPVIASVEMLVAGILGVAMFHEKLNYFNLFGIALLLLSIVLMNTKKDIKAGDAENCEWNNK